jgi:glutaredoxin 3
MTTKDVVVYSSPTCASCTAVKEFLKTRGVPFTTKDITFDEKALEELEARTGDAGGVPVIVVGEEVIVGFDPARLQAALGM